LHINNDDIFSGWSNSGWSNTLAQGGDGNWYVYADMSIRAGKAGLVGGVQGEGGLK